MQRREFITLLGGAAATWPLMARAQQPAMPVIGFFHSASPGTVPHFVDAFRRGLRETGYVEGQNVAIEYRWAEGQNDRLPGLADDLVRRGVAVLFASGGGGLSARAAKAAAATIPIVFSSADDSVKAGIVASFNRPGGNATGVYLFASIVETKRLGLLHELIPTTQVIAVLVNATSTLAETQTADLQAAARSLGRHRSKSGRQGASSVCDRPIAIRRTPRCRRSVLQPPPRAPCGIGDAQRHSSDL
jgi:putative ABC transport system substrate-binding protein